jgi:hypothetical protein
MRKFLIHQRKYRQRTRYEPSSSGFSIFFFGSSRVKPMSSCSASWRTKKKRASHQYFAISTKRPTEGWGRTSEFIVKPAALNSSITRLITLKSFTFVASWNIRISEGGAMELMSIPSDRKVRVNTSAEREKNERERPHPSPWSIHTSPREL